MWTTKLSRGRWLVMVSAFSLVMSGLAIIANTTPARGNEACELKGTAAGKTVNATSLAEVAGAMASTGASPAEVDAVFSRDWCLKKIAGTMASGDGAVNGGDLVWDLGIWLYVRYEVVGVEPKYFATGRWSWVNRDYGSNFLRWRDTFTPCIGSALGGADGYGMSVDSGLYNVDSWASVGWGDPSLNDRTKYPLNYEYWVATGSREENATAWEWNNKGIGHKRQDNARAVDLSSFPSCWDEPVDLDMYGGQLLFSFKPYDGNGCRNVSLHANYSHTWDDTSVTGISFSDNGVGFSWSTTEEYWQWEATSEPVSVC